MIVIGLTGSIGMGKSTTARMFADAGIPVHDSDGAVHRIYEGPDAALIEKEFPGTLVDGRIDRERLGELILSDREAMKRLETIVHPLVRRDADAFVARHRAAGAPAVVLDIPLLFETGGTDRVDRIVVVSAPADIQRERVLARPGMTPEKFEAILARQVPDAEKRRRADHVIDSAQGLEPARRGVEAIVEEIRRETDDRA